MVVWYQDGTGFVYFDRTKHFSYAVDADTSKYLILADNATIGTVATEVEAKRVMNKIVAYFTSGQAECNPW